jgi:hypothetical protein
MASRGSTSSANGLLPPLSGNHHDEEAGPSKAFDHDDIHAPTSDPFDIAYTKNAPFETLRRWRVILLLLLLLQQQQCLHIAIPFCISIVICSIFHIPCQFLNICIYVHVLSSNCLTHTKAYIYPCILFLSLNLMELQGL